jgi:hypothetical protein
MIIIIYLIFILNFNDNEHIWYKSLKNQKYCNILDRVDD